QVYICFDSDVMLKAPVHAAMARLADFLQSRGARVAYIYLPPAADGGKLGLDDFLAAGHSVADLLALASAARLRLEPDAPSQPTYSATPAGLVWHRQDRDGVVDVQLTNFIARIVADIVEDDGAETHRVFE